MLLPPPSHPFILPFSSSPYLRSLLFSHSASLLNSALTSALPKTTTKESRSLAVPGWSWALVLAELGVQPLSQRTGTPPILCSLPYTWSWAPPCILGGRTACTCVLGVRTLADGAREGTLHREQLSTHLPWSRSWSGVGVPGTWATHTQSCECEVSLQIHICTHACTGPTALPSPPCFSGASHGNISSALYGHGTPGSA